MSTEPNTFEGHAQQIEGGSIVSKAKTACKVLGHAVDHFADVGKMVDLGSGSQGKVSSRHVSNHFVGVNKMVGLDAAKGEKALKNFKVLGS